MKWLLSCSVLYFITLGLCGEIIFTNVPSGLDLVGDSALKQSLLKDVFSSMLGYTVSKSHKWGGLVISDPYHFAEGVVVVVAENVSPSSFRNKPHFPLRLDESVDRTREALLIRTMERYPTQNSTFINLNLESIENEVLYLPQLLDEVNMDPSSFELHALDATQTADYYFLEEMKLLNDIAKNVPSKTNILNNGAPDVLWFKSEGLSGMAESYGKDSESFTEANNIFENVITSFSEAFGLVYNDKVVVAIISVDPTSRIRKVRDAADYKNTNSTPGNISKDYSENYPAMFNIFLWLCIGFALTVVVIVVCIGTMDPGRDSIIYRVTSQKIKKDN